MQEADKAEAKAKADADKLKTDADKLKGDTRRLLAASAQLATETVYSEYPFEVSNLQAPVVSGQPVGMFMYAKDAAGAFVKYDDAFRGFAYVEYIHRDRATGAIKS